ncbi:MAG TPA: MlaA family lipoprotein [Candidatus Azoamicus sp.]
MKYSLFIFIFLYLLFFNSNILSPNNLDTLNRRVYAFNRGIDKIFMNPCTDLYINVFPPSLKVKVENFFSNLFDIQNICLSCLLNKFDNFNKLFSKVVVNSTVGFFGFLNISVYFDLNIRSSSFFDIRTFPFSLSKRYMLLPVIGPGFISNNLNLLILQFFNPIFHVFNNLFFFYFFDLMSKKNIINFDINFFHSNVLDGYSFLKDVYFQRFYTYKNN